MRQEKFIRKIYTKYMQEGNQQCTRELQISCPNSRINFRNKQAKSYTIGGRIVISSRRCIEFHVNIIL